MLKQLRTRRQLPVVNKTQIMLAKEIGVSISQFKRYESGQSPIPLHIALRWAEALDISIEVFVTLYEKDVDWRI